ncbi:heat shock 70 kDa protein 12A-like [Ruditapes philippinarum]|uniref:heat shock 70 kDa protein 12A-like n=1 Tax=Ruditapes philippinarum TaxID=129788 RepID=UPI00295A90FD|nr:heat shock 70 kDa protein 12A-like [Ruditapes philippinarum]
MKLFVKGLPLHKDMEIEDILGKPMKAIDIFSGAIRYIKEHLLNVLNDPDREDQLSVKPDTDIRWVLTVPAIWNDLSKKFMREAAANAGIPDHMLLLALEPEAASLYCKRELGTDTIPIGCRYLVLDLGGGTADITCHEVNTDGTLKELHPPTGGDFGGTNVDNAFMNVLVRIFGADIIKQFKQQCMNGYWS